MLIAECFLIKFYRKAEWEKAVASEGLSLFTK